MLDFKEWFVFVIVFVVVVVVVVLLLATDWRIGGLADWRID